MKAVHNVITKNSLLALPCASYATLSKITNLPAPLM